MGLFSSRRNAVKASTNRRCGRLRKPKGLPKATVTATRFVSGNTPFRPSDAAERRCKSMDFFRNLVARIYTTDLRREEGQTMTEYGVLLALIAVVVIAALLVLGPKIATVFTKVSNQL
jgi:pilus assembly protein Flp/PilA